MPTRERLAICLSFVCTSVLGTWFIVSHWLTRDVVALAYVRAVGFTGIMAGVHFVAFRMHQCQFMTAQPPALHEAPAATQPPAVRRHILWRLAWSILACPFIVMAINEFVAHHELRTRILESGRSLDSVPFTMLGQYPASDVALACFGVICVLIGFRSPTGSQQEHKR